MIYDILYYLYSSSLVSHLMCPFSRVSIISRAPSLTSYIYPMSMLRAPTHAPLLPSTGCTLLRVLSQWQTSPSFNLQVQRECWKAAMHKVLNSSANRWNSESGSLEIDFIRTVNWAHGIHYTSNAAYDDMGQTTEVHLNILYQWIVSMRNCLSVCSIYNIVFGYQ